MCSSTESSRDDSILCSICATKQFQHVEDHEVVEKN